VDTVSQSVNFSIKAKVNVERYGVINVKVKYVFVSEPNNKANVIQRLFSAALSCTVNCFSQMAGISLKLTVQIKIDVKN